MGPALALGAGLTAAPTYPEELARMRVDVPEVYRAQRPRLLFGPDDTDALRERAVAEPERWNRVLRSARGLGQTAPEADAIAAGRHYWRIERVQSGALAYVLGGDRAHLDAAARWMTAHCRVPIWGEAYRPNVDLEASWYLYHIAIAYDLLHEALAPADRDVIRDGLIDHARAIHESFAPVPGTRWRFDQNHTYIPATALAAAALALLGEAPDAAEWLHRAATMMHRARHVLGEDGAYYEGTAYWIYALHWHVRYAELMARATGAPAMDLPILRHNHLYAWHMSLPGAPHFFDVGDTGRWTDRPTPIEPVNLAMLHAVASHLRLPDVQAVANALTDRHPEGVYHASAFLWYDANLAAADLDALPAYHHFADHGLVAWRSGWGEDATVVLFRCGPSQGHAAAAKLAAMEDWTMNSGHVHPDIGAFWLYARGAYLVGDTGYVAEKRALDHNTLLVSGEGQGVDGSYWYERGWPYARFDQARILRVHLEDAFGYVRGVFGSVYPEALGPLDLHRTLVMTRDVLLVIDELEAGRPQTLTWLAHSTGAFAPEGDGHRLRLDGAALRVRPLHAVATDAVIEPAVVMAGTAPGRGVPTARGYRFRAETREPSRSIRLVHALLPHGADEDPPEVVRLPDDHGQLGVELAWPDGRRQTLWVDPGAEGPPVRIGHR